MPTQEGHPVGLLVLLSYLFQPYFPTYSYRSFCKGMSHVFTHAGRCPPGHCALSSCDGRAPGFGSVLPHIHRQHVLWVTKLP